MSADGKDHGRGAGGSPDGNDAAGATGNGGGSGGGGSGGSGKGGWSDATARERAIARAAMSMSQPAPSSAVDFDGEIAADLAAGFQNDDQNTENEGISEGAFADARKSAETFNDSVLGTIAGYLGFKQRPSLAHPGAIETSVSVNPVGIATGLFAPGLGFITGPLAKSLGFPDVEVASFSNATPATDPGFGLGDGDLAGLFGSDYQGSPSFGISGGGGVDTVSGGAGDDTGFGGDAGPSFGVSGGTFDGNGGTRDRSVTAADRGISDKEAIAATIGLAAVALELGG